METVSGPGERPSLEWLPVDRLEVDPRYQRAIDTPASKRLITRIAENFLWVRFQAILATPADPDGWLVIDGQHRVEAARKRGMAEVPAVVVGEADLAAQAAAFVGANRDRVPMSAQALYHARLVAGDPDAVTIDRMCTDAGLSVVRHNQSVRQLPAGRIAAVPALLRMLEAYDEDITGRAIMAVGRVFNTTPGVLSGQIFMAAAMYLRNGGQPDELRRRLRAVGPERFFALSKALGQNSAAASILAALERDGPLPFRGPEPAPPPRTARVQPERKVAKPAPKPERAPPKVTAGPPALKREVAAAPASAPRERRTADQAAIDKFLAERGARLVMSPEQVAAFLRDSGYQVVVRLAAPDGRTGTIWLPESRVTLDGEPVKLDDIYRIANELRGKAGLRPVSPPEQPRAATPGSM